MAAKKREEKLKKAEKSTQNNAYGIVHGKDRYVKEETYLNKREHIRAHFLICFIALVILRLIQNSMGTGRLSVERIAEALRGANCLLERGGYVRLLDVGGKIGYEENRDRKSGKMVPSLKFSSTDQVALDYRRIQDTFGTDFYYVYAKQEDFKRFFKEMGLGKRA